MFGDKLLLLKKGPDSLRRLMHSAVASKPVGVFVTYLSGNHLIDQKLYPPVTRLTSHTQSVV
jgi:hypothetical protein